MRLGRVESHGYISSMMEQNQISVSGSEYDIVNFYMSNSAQYVLFAVILGTLGWMSQKNARVNQAMLPSHGAGGLYFLK